MQCFLGIREQNCLKKSARSESLPGGGVKPPKLTFKREQQKFKYLQLEHYYGVVWCLECAEVNTSPQFLKTYTGYLLVSE